MDHIDEDENKYVKINVGKAREEVSSSKIRRKERYDLFTRKIASTTSQSSSQGRLKRNWPPL